MQNDGDYACTREQMRLLDKTAIEDYGINGLVLMENAGRRSAAVAAEMLAAAVQGVRDRGKADVGEKTMLDALVPASDAMAAAVSAGSTLGEALAAAVAAAEAGVQATIDMKATMGRARWFSDRTQGVQDPGATAVTLMLQCISEYVTA